MTTQTDDKKPEIVEIIAHRYSIDWTYDTPHKIDLNEILGFRLEYRYGPSWHVVVVTKRERRNQDGSFDRYESYDLDHWVGELEIAKLIANPKAIIQRVENYCRSKNFCKEFHKILEMSKKYEEKTS